MNNLIDSVAIIYTIFVELYVVKSLSKRKIIYSLVNFIVLFIVIVLYYLNGLYNYTVSKNIVYILLYCINNYMFFRNSYFQTFILTIFYYILGGALELILSIILFSGFSDITVFDSNHLLKMLYSILVNLFLILIFKIKKTKTFLQKIYNNIYVVKDKVVLVSMILVFIGMNVLVISNAKNISVLNYLNNVVILIVLFIFELLLFSQYLKLLLTEKNNEILLDFMIKYEKIIDDDKINRHEMLNNLIILKNIQKNNNIEFEKLINKLIKKYDNNKLKYLNNIYNLPKGIKGVIYYKFYDMKEKDINVNLIIADECNKMLKSFDTNLYFSISKIIGILLDNAKEATMRADNKEVTIDIYNENNSLFIVIMNTVKENVDLKHISKKNYSSKGKNRGLGLYIANKTIKKYKDKLSLNFEINNNIFTSKFIIKK